MKPTLAELSQRDLLQLAESCARAGGCTVETMFSRSQYTEESRARRLFYAALSDAGWSDSAIARFVGRDRGAIGDALRKKATP
jgi:hypothetical protein